jgi:hypothetical protein
MAAPSRKLIAEYGPVLPTEAEEGVSKEDSV